MQIRRLIGPFTAGALALGSSLAGCREATTVAVRADSLRMDLAYMTRCRTLEAVPAPTESAARLHKLDPIFRADLTLPTARIDYMHTGAQQALALGAYASDLAYANLYQRPIEASASLKALNALAERLEVADAIGAPQLADDLSRGLSSDSLLSRLNLGLTVFNSRLQTRGQLPLSVLAVTGGWIEGMHLLCRPTDAKASLTTRRSLAAGQKPVLDLLLECWPDEKEVSPEQWRLYVLLHQAQAVLATASVRQTAMAGGGEWTEVDGMPVFTSPKRSQTDLAPEAFRELSLLIAQARTLVEQGGAFSTKPTIPHDATSL